MSAFSGYLDFAKDLALRVGSRLRQGQAGPLAMRFKGPADVVTDLDILADERITSALRERFPDHAILAEESGARPGGNFRWLVDPLDGTVNFARRWPHWAVSLALEFRGEVVVGVVYAPACGELYWAERGAGAYRDGTRLHVSKVSHLKEALLNFGSVSLDPDEPLRAQPYGRLLGAVFKTRQLGVCSLDLAWLASGKVDAVLMGHSTPWDVAAGLLLVQEAGGRLTRPDGSPFALADPAFIASNGLLHEEMTHVLSWRHGTRKR